MIPSSQDPMPQAPQKSSHSDLLSGASNSVAVSYPWIKIVEADDLEQGDIFERCPAFIPPDDIPDNIDEVEVGYHTLDLIVMSQSCDLAKGREKIEHVCLCKLTTIPNFIYREKPASRNILEDIRSGKIPRYHMIDCSVCTGLERDIRIVDLQQVYSLPLAFLRRRASKERHLRLLPPYREHLSQAFARVFMRVGLPIDIPPFKEIKK